MLIVVLLGVGGPNRGLQARRRRDGPHVDNGKRAIVAQRIGLARYERQPVSVGCERLIRQQSGRRVHRCPGGRGADDGQRAAQHKLMAGGGGKVSAAKPHLQLRTTYKTLRTCLPELR